jgi:nucleotide-binding universal stress UspA family protein
LKKLRSFLSALYPIIALRFLPKSVSHGDYNERSAENAAEILSAVSSATQAAGIECDVIHEQNRWPYEGEIEVAEKVGADLIIVGSHGRRGIEGLLIGSQTTKLLTHTKIPALVVR